jgi:hypothetical protein
MLVAVAVAVGLLVPANAGAAEPPVYDGDLTFHRINGPEDPEEFSWQVELRAGEELRQIDETDAAVFYKSGYSAFSITAELAHDAIGTNVPTTLTVTEPNIITLTVHHREGNPAAGGAPFDYPIVAGAGWEGGIRPPTIIQGPPDEAELRAARERAAAAATSAPPSTAPEQQRVLVVRALGDDKLYYRPHFFLLSGDGTFGINKVQWKHYGGATATASARAFVNDCVPYCAAGHIDRPRAALKLSKVVDCNGTPIYARLEYTLTGPLPKGFPRRGGYSMRPLGEDGKPEC